MPRTVCLSESPVTALGLGPLTAGIIAFGMALSPANAASCMYEVVATLQGPPCPEIWTPPAVPWAINDHNEVVGYYDFCVIGGRRAFYWTQETGVVTLSFPFTFTESRAYDISDNGWIVGTVNLSGDSFGTFGFVMRPDGSGLQLIPPLPGHTYCEALAINDNLQVVGYAAGGASGNPSVAFLWDNGSLINLQSALPFPTTKAHDINSSGEITGLASDSDGGLAFVYRDGRVEYLNPLPGFVDSNGITISDAGHVAGHEWIPIDCGRPPCGHSRGFRWFEGEMIDIGMLPECTQDVIVYEVNDRGDVVGYCEGGEFPGHFAYIWMSGSLHAVEDLLCEPNGTIIDIARDVNHQGFIVGNGLIPVNPGPDPYVGVVLAPIALRADLSGDGVVGGIDLAMLLGQWGRCPQCAGDLDGDGAVGGTDVAILLASWGP